MNSNNRAAPHATIRPRSWLFAAVLLIFCASAQGADVLYIESSPVDPAAREQVKSAAAFLGLTLDVGPIQSKQDGALLQALHSPDLVAVIISADSLPLLDQKAILGSLQRPGGAVPLMISGVSERIDRKYLRQWSDGAVSGAVKIDVSGRREWYEVGTGNDVTRQLGGSQLPILAEQLDYLTLNRAAENLLLLTDHGGDSATPAFVRVRVQNQSIFVAAENHAVAPPATPDPFRQPPMFASMAALILFLHYAGGDRVWHSPAAYANFTVDDPWLRQPYGYVNYEELVQHARAHNFHATVAFIPWNFDRSQSSVVSLFRENPDKLSISIHGNNHVHQEFGPLASHALSEQVENMRQGLARMEKFRALTHIQYDPVIIFPHSIAPEATFSELRKNQYLGTANSLNVPSDATAPGGADFALRTATLRFGDFPSLRRYSAEADIPPAQIAIDAFLGNPILFYAHESFFASGMDAFDKTADLVNGLQPGTRWDGLGSIIRHLYLERRRSDGKYELRAFSSKLEITNDHDRDADYVLEKNESFSHGLTALIDGRSIPFTKSGNVLQATFQIERGATKEFSVRYADEAGLASIDTAKTSFHTNAIRLLSDFRDNVVSRSLPGRKFIESYADNGRAWNLFFLSSGGLGLVLLLTWYITRSRRSIRVSGLDSATRQASGKSA
jgi:hypothetical protein